MKLRNLITVWLEENNYCYSLREDYPVNNTSVIYITNPHSALVVFDKQTTIYYHNYKEEMVELDARNINFFKKLKELLNKPH